MSASTSVHRHPQRTISYAVPPPKSTRLNLERKILSVLKWVTVVVTVFISAGPLLYGIFLSLTPLTQVINNPLDIFPSLSALDFDSYPTALKSTEEGGFGLAGFMWNSLLVALGTVAISIAFSVLGAYAAVRLRFLGRNVANAMFLMVYLFPGI